MKRLLCALLAALMLCGCAAPAGTTPTTVPGETDGPRLKAGFYIYDQDEAGSSRGDAAVFYRKLR